jgi:hypothetical protein
VFCAIYRLLGQRVKYVKYPNTQWLEQRIDQDYKELEQIRQQIHEIYYPPEQKR